MYPCNYQSITQGCSGDPDFPSPGKHNIVKSRVHGGECLKCGLVGSWDFIKTQECKPVSAMGVMSDELCKALEDEDNSRALAIVEMMEAQDEQERLMDQEMALQLMEEELQMLQLTEQLEALQLQELQEEEKLQTSTVEKQLTRPPATPAVSTTPIPVIKEPAVCP